MPTHSQLAAQLLRDAAAFFDTIGQQNEPLREQMMENAAVFTEVAMLVETDPNGEIQGNFVSGSGESGGHDHEGGCCGGHGHHHHGHDHDHGHAHGHDHDHDHQHGGCGGKGGCNH